MTERSMEVKVGALIVVSLVLLVGFVVLLGGLSLKPTFRVFVQFEDPGGLQSGAPVRMSGVRVGRVTAIEFLGGVVDQQGKPVPPIRVVVDIEAAHRKAVHQDARFYVTAQGMLGEMHLAIEPGTFNQPILAEGATVTGVSPPRLDLLISESYELLHRSYKGVVDNERKISEAFDGLHKTLTGTGALFDKHQTDISTLIERLEQLTEESEATLKAAREQYVDGARINRILSRLDHTTLVLDENLEPLLRDGRLLMQDGRKVSAFLAEDTQLTAVRELTGETKQMLQTAHAAARDVGAIVAHIKAGRGSAGALIMDEALFDDFQELMRDLKHNPWKIMWKE